MSYYKRMPSSKSRNNNRIEKSHFESRNGIFDSGKDNQGTPKPICERQKRNKIFPKDSCKEPPALYANCKGETHFL